MMVGTVVGGIRYRWRRYWEEVMVSLGGSLVVVLNIAWLGKL